MRLFSANSAQRRGMPTRRGFLRTSVQAGMAGLSLPAVLKLKADAAEQGATAKDTAVIQIWLGGGPSHFETYDPKPDAPADFRGPFGSIPTELPGVRFCELMPKQAALMRKLVVVRSVHHTTDDHYAGMHWCTTAHSTNTGNFTPTHPSTGSVVARVREQDRRGLPSYVHLGFRSGNPVYDANHNAAYLGGGYDPFRITADANDAAFRVDNVQLVDGVTLDRLADRKQLRQHFDGIRRDLDASGTMRVLDHFDQMALDLVTGEKAREAFDLSREDPRLRDRYGRNRWGQSVLLARRLVEQGVSFVTVNTDPHSFTWDMHGSLTKPGIDSNARTMPEVGPMLDQMVSTLVEDLCDRGLDRKVLVVVWGEFGRTPRVNATGGRDHWGGAMSVLLAGGGFRMGQVIGSTTAKGEVPKDRPLWPHDVAATMYHHLGIDPSQTFLNTTGRPVPVLSDGEVIRELV